MRVGNGARAMCSRVDLEFWGDRTSGWELLLGSSRHLGVIRGLSWKLVALTWLLSSAIPRRLNLQSLAESAIPHELNLQSMKVEAKSGKQILEISRMSREICPFLCLDRVRCLLLLGATEW